MVSYKWIYKIKTHSDGLLSDIRLVLLQKVLHKSMGLIMKRPLLRLLESHLFEPFAVAAASKWDFFQMDVKNVFLNRNLSEEVYMQPLPVSLNKVCHLR